MQERKPVIETVGLSKSYKGVQALRGLSLKVMSNSIFGFLGPNGAGKTTTIKLLLGLAAPSSGSARVFGHDIVRESVDVRRRVGYLAQEPHYYDYMTARETLRFTAGFFYSGSRAAVEERVQQTLDLVGLKDKADRPIKGFSGGERQRLGIAQAQVNYPDLLILDEPAASLDPQGRRDVLEIMERLRKHTTIFYSTHILDDVQRVSDTVAILNRGELIAEAPIDELLHTSGGAIVYTVVLRGNTAPARQRLAGQPWVAALNVGEHSDYESWHVSVTDERAAESRLLPLLFVDSDVQVHEFSRQENNLESVFLSLVKGDNDGNQ